MSADVRRIKRKLFLDQERASYNFPKRQTVAMIT